MAATISMQTFSGSRIFGTRYIWSSGKMLEKRYIGYCCHQNIKESSIICASRTNWSLNFVPAQPGECRRVQFCSCFWMFSTQEPYMSCVWNAWTKFVWFSEAKQIFAIATQVYSTNSSAGKGLKRNTNIKLDLISFFSLSILLAGFDSVVKIKTTWLNPCWSQTRKYYARGSSQTTLQVK